MVFFSLEFNPMYIIESMEIVKVVIIDIMKLVQHTCILIVCKYIGIMHETVVTIKALPMKSVK